MAKIDTAQFDHITDRVARARAKAEAMRQAKAAADGDGGSAPEAPQAAAPEAPGATGAAPSGGQKASGLSILGFSPGTHCRWKGRAGRITDVRYDFVRFVYDDDPDRTIVVDRFRLSHAHAEGNFEFAPKPEAYRPERVGKSDRVDYHEYVWLDTRKGMAAKKRRPRAIAIVNPDYCTGCNACIEVCPTDCIEEVDVADAGLDGLGHFCEVRLDDCIGCVQCVHICPWEAIHMVDTQQVEEAYGIPEGTL